MSNGNGISFVHDLVAMATAADKVPQLEARIAELEEIKAGYETGFVEKEKQLIDHLNAHDETKARLHNAEVARDDAERLFLEADDAKLAAVRAMRIVIGEAEAFIKAVTRVEELAKPSYEGKWLWDVQDWSGLSLNEWLNNGGSVSRFVAVRLAEPASPNVQDKSTWSIEDKPNSQVTAEQEAASRLQSAAYSVGATQEVTGPNPTVSDLGHIQAATVGERREWNEDGWGEPAIPTANTLGSDHGPSPSAPSDLAASKESASTTTSEDLREVGPTSADDSGFTNEKLLGSNDKTLEGNNSDPFAASHSGSASQTADTGDAGTQESASEKSIDDDLWAIPSRASHYSS